MQRFHRLLVALAIISVCVQPLSAATPLKQSTAITIPVGPFVLATDGSAVTSQTVTSITSRIYKGPSPTPATLTLSASGGDNDLVVDSTTGQWTLELTSGNTDTLGPLRVSFANGTTFVPFHEDFEVLPANVYESLYGSDKLEVDVVQNGGTGWGGSDAPENLISFFDNGGNTTNNTVDTIRNPEGFTSVVRIGTGDDAESVIEAQTAGTLCLLAPGTHAIGGDAIVVPAGVTVRGAGRDITTITSTNTSVAIVRPGNNSCIEDLTIESLNTTEGVFDFPLGATTGSFENAVCRRLRLIGRSDGIYVTTATPCSGRFEDVISETKYDGWLTFGAAHHFEWDNCEARLTVDNETDGGVAVALRGAGGYYKFNNCRIRVENPSGGSATAMIGVQTHVSDEVRVELFNTAIALVGSASSSNFAVDHNSSGLFQVAGCDFDRTKVDGTITDVRGGPMGLADGAITEDAFDNDSAFPLTSADSGDTTVLRKGSASVTGTTLDTAISGVSGAYVSESGTAQAGASGTITLRSGAVATDDYYNYQILTLTGGTGAGQARIISDYVGSTKVASVNGNWAVNPDNTTTYTVTAFGQIPGASAPTAGEVADAVWDESTTGHTTGGTFGAQAKTVLDGTFTSAAWEAFVTDAPTIEEGVQSGMEAQGYTTARAAKIDNADVATSSRLAPTTAGRTIDVTAGGAAGIDWGNVENPTTTLALSGTSTLALEPTTAGRKLDVTSGGAAGIDWSNVENPTTTLNLSGTSTLALEPTTAGRKLDVTTGGEAGIDLGNVGNPTATLNLSGLTIKTATDVEADTSNIQARLPAELVGGKMDAVAEVDFELDEEQRDLIVAGVVEALEDGLLDPADIWGFLLAGEAGEGTAAKALADVIAAVDSGTYGNAALKTALDLKASQSSVDDLPTNAELDVKLDGLEIDTSSLTNKLEDIEEDTQDIQGRLPATLNDGKMRSDATLVADEELIEDLAVAFVTAGVGGSPISPTWASESDVWTFENTRQIEATNRITIAANRFNGVVEMDFAKAMSGNVALFSVTGVTISPTAGEEPTLGIAKLSASKKRVVIPVDTKPDSTAADAGVYTVTVTVVTTDNQTTTRIGKLVVR